LRKENQVLAASNFLVPNATFVVELIAFLVVLGIVARFIIPPISRAMHRRQEEIELAIAKGREAELRLVAAEDAYQNQVAAGRHKARLVVERAHGQNEHLRQQARRRADEEYLRRTARAQVAIDRAAERVRRQLRQEMDVAGIAPARDVVSEELDRCDDRALSEDGALIDGTFTSEEAR
jgi:F-type H+-transporting ATPase subunit b